MKLNIISDLHFEFTNDAKYIRDYSADEIDVLVLAGDIGVGCSALSFIEEQTRKQPVIYVLGNHEFYNQDMQETRDYWNTKHNEIDNLYVLDNKYIDLGNYRFIGTTLWSDTSGPRIPMNDYRYIKYNGANFTQQDSCRLFQENVSWLTNAITDSDKECVIITHHLPSIECISKKYWNSPCNKAFYSPLDHLLEINKVKLWVHGHTHDSIDKIIKGTRVVCNPRGYPDRQGFENTKFNDNLLIDLK